MGRKKKQKKTAEKRQKPVKKEAPQKRGFSIWGILSCIIGCFYLTYFIYLLFIFRIAPTMNFQYILYAFSIFPFGMVGLIMGLFAMKNREQLGFAGVLFSLLGMAAYAYVWYLVMTTTPHAAVQQTPPQAP